MSQRLTLADGGDIYIGYPELSITRHGVAIVGDNLHGTSTLLRQARSVIGVLVRPDSTVVPIPRPPAAHSPRYLRIAADWTGELHAVWGAAEPASDTLLSPEIHQLWAARWRPTGWDQPVMVWQGARLRWELLAQSRLHRRNDAMHLLAPLDDATGAHLVYARWAGDRWSTQRLATSRSAVYTSVLAREAVVHAAVVHADPSSPGRDRNSVFALSSRDGGTTWGDAVLVSRSGANAAHNAALFPADSLHTGLVWVWETSDPLHSDSLRIALQRRGDTTWALARGVALPNGLRRVQVAADPEHGVVIAGTPVSLAPDPILLASPRGGEWAVFDGPPSSRGALALGVTTRNDSVTLIHSVRADGRDDAFVTLLTHGTIVCATQR